MDVTPPQIATAAAPTRAPGAPASATQAPPAGAPPLLDPQLVDAAAGGAAVDALVFFETPDVPTIADAQARLGAAEAMPLGTERKVAAFEAMHDIGEATLAEHRPELQSLVEAGRASGVDELWSVGAVRVRGASLDTLRELAGEGVKAITLDTVVAQPAVPAAADDAIRAAAELPEGASFNRELAGASAEAEPQGDEVLMDWGVARMKAPAAWQQGITGAGIVIGSLDTGIAPEHPALNRAYRGTQADGTMQHDYNWKDVVKELPEDGSKPDGTPWNPDDVAANGTSKVPIDLNGHGTHTSGSAVGWSPNHLIGTAPDAKLVGTRGLGNKGGTLFDLMSAMEWFLAPTKVDGSDPRPDLAPDVVTNSWGGPPTGNPFLWLSLRQWKRAGLVPVFASGNARQPLPGQVAAPGMYPEAITVGASDLDETRAWFSMFGPSPYSENAKPDVVAPGHWTYSALPDGTTRDVFPIGDRLAPASGTSMATPHVAGAVALYLQANPGSTFEQVADAIRGAGTIAGEPSDEMGHGRVAIESLITEDAISPDATRTDKARVDELMAQVARAEVYKEGERKPGPPTAAADAPADEREAASAPAREPVAAGA